MKRLYETLKGTEFRKEVHVYYKTTCVCKNIYGALVAELSREKLAFTLENDYFS